MVAAMLGFRASLVLLIVTLSGLASPGRHAASAADCPPDGMCHVAGGYYRAHVPPGWDGRQLLPVLLHFHGYRESAAEMVARQDLRAFAERNGILLVVPQGEGNTWSHPGSPARFRDEFGFVDAVLADIRVRYPLDRARFLASGFSQGAAMVWNLACHRGRDFSAFLAISGTFWLPQPESCPSGAQNLIQIHGISDRTVPLEGRPIRDGAFRQGDVFRAMGMMRRMNACPVEAGYAHREGALACERIDSCASGKWLELCLHPGGHDFDPSWLEIVWRLVKGAETR